ncbi:MAG: O-antigen ligase domain-containing protein [Nitrospiraceae bacterium]|nr:MAG: O-antigen ligase domain-containing protein [Nitrospiraceae bacterium]
MPLKENAISLIRIKLFDMAGYWLIGILLIIPFQPRISLITQLWNSRAANIFNKLDELTIIIFFPLAAYILYRNYKEGRINCQLYGIFVFPIITVISMGFISGLLNQNSMYITAHGIFSYIKNFLLIFIYAAFFREGITFQKIFQLMLIIAVCVGVIAIIHELWAMYLKYSDYDLPISIFNNIQMIMIMITGGKIDPFNWRMGIYRTPSIMTHYNLLGFYSIFIISIYLTITKKINAISFSSLFAGVLLSVSRLAFLCFAFLAGFQILKGRKWFIVLLIPLLPLLLYAVFISHNSVFSDEINVPRDTITGEEIKEGMTSYREYARSKTLEVWRDYPVLGVGPGMFGGDIAVKNNSPYYEEYNAFVLLKHFRTLDQFWPQALAEMGIVGTIAFAGLLVSLFLTFLLSRQLAADELTRGLFTGLTVFTVFVFFSTFSNSLNNAPILFPYCAVAGMGLGCGGRHETA